MDYGIAFVAGAIHKFYDDIEDNKVPLSPLNLELLKVLMVSTMTMMFMRSPGVSLFFLVIIAIYASLGRIDTDLWKACVPIPFLTSLIHYDQYGFLTTVDTLQRLFVMAIVAGLMYFEDGWIPEETSIRKTLVRIGFIAIASTFLWFYRSLPSITFVGPLLWFLIGYLLANIVYHYDTVFSRLTQRKSSQQSVLPTETKNKETLAKPPSASDFPPQDDAHSLASDSDNIPLISSEAE